MAACRKEYLFAVGMSLLMCLGMGRPMLLVDLHYPCTQFNPNSRIEIFHHQLHEVRIHSRQQLRVGF
jgi:hypothetical protein